MSIKNYISKKILTIITIFFVVIMAASFSSRSVPVIPPVPVERGCPLTSAEFNSWFKSGSVTLNGIVKPFVSEDFPRKHDTSDCVSFKWSEQTFLWLTSPTQLFVRLDNQVSKGITERIFESPAFYDVSPPGADGKRSFIPHEPGKIRVFSMRDAQAGANKLPVMFEKKTGRLLEIEQTPVSPKGLPLILNKDGIQTEIAGITLDNSGKAVFKDNSGKVFQNPGPLVRKKSYPKSIVNKYVIGRKVIYLDAEGNNIEVEEGQAGGGDVLMSQNNSLVYYSISVNQNYVFFHSAERNEDAPLYANTFNRQSEMEKVAAYAAIFGKTILYPEVMPMEIKCSWVEAASLPDASTYIKMIATIPTYNKTSNQWIPNGQKTVELAMVGMHIVGNVDWFPDMLWATFEHIDNTPNATYFYYNTNNPPIRNANKSPIRNANKPPTRNANTPASSSLFEPVPQNTSGRWTFCADGSNGPFNVSRMHVEGNKIVANPGFNIGSSNIIRWKPWGSGSPLINTELKTLNNSVMNMLKDGDLRKNYIQIGTTWKVSGVPESVERGSTRLANSTMETYLQGTSNSITTGTTCFSCHTRGVFDDGSNDWKAYSHIYYSLKPLLPVLHLVK